MKIIILILLVIVQSLSYAAEPTASEIEAVDKMFTKVRYILGAAFNVHNLKFLEPEKYGNIPAFMGITENLKQDVHTISKEIKLLNKNAGGIDLFMVIINIEMCVANMGDSYDYCKIALTILKDFFWIKKFGKTWSGYPSLTLWVGFPDSMK